MDIKKLKEKLARMTLEEKLLELTQYNCRDLIESAGKNVVTGVNSEVTLDSNQYLRTGTVLNSENAEDVIELRKVRKDNGITEPIAVMRDVIHGYRTDYPIPLAMACAFDLTLVEDCAEMAAVEARYDGTDVTFSPMVDLVRDARWGRVMESAGEDPYVAGETGKAFIRGYHKGGIACCVKHFAGYGAAEAGRDYNSTEISEHTLNEYYLKGYKACMEEKPELVMSSFNAINGIPVLGHKEIMVDKLRKEWGFDGVLISDYNSVGEMINHGYCEDLKACAQVAIDAELDIEMCSPSYAKYLPQLIKEGKVTEEQVDRAVMRVLQLKNKLGLYENPSRYTDIEKRDSVTLSKKHRTLARKAAEESCVLLKNDGVLPLNEDKKVFLCGPFADEKDIFGHWHCSARGSDTVSFKEGVENLLGKTVSCVKGCTYDFFDTDESQFSKAMKTAEEADVILACIGESMWHSGEAQSRTNINVPLVQVNLVKQLKRANKPLVLVVFGGRPLVLTEVEKYADAILYAWQPGTEGGNALANLLYGKSVPSGKTTISFPRSVGQCPIYYNHFKTGRPKVNDDVAESFHSGYLDCKNAPLYPFGYGLSYTKFSYSDLTLDKSVVHRGEKIVATVKVKNTGDCDAKEIAQWYICDKFASVVRPVKELKGFEKLLIKKGEEKTLRFEITEDMLAFYTASGEFKAELGEFILFVGGNSEDCLKTEFKLCD